MLLNSGTIDNLLEVAAASAPGRLAEALNHVPAAMYVTDREGVITFYNDACVPLAGRVPETGVDKWCVTWKLYTPEGAFLPHNECPMAVAIRDQRPIRGVEAIAERPDGTRFTFTPFPTPLFDDDGNFAGAVNLLLDVTHLRTPFYFEEQALRCRRLAAGISTRDVAETLQSLAASYEKQALQASRVH